MIRLCRVLEADILMATDALGPSNSPDDDGLETPDRILYSDLSTGMKPQLRYTQLRSHTDSSDVDVKNAIALLAC